MKKLISTLIFAFLTVSVPAATIYVDANGTGDYPTIQDAIDAANDGDTVLVADGVYTGDGNRDIDFLGKAITVRSENGPNNCIIDCNGTEAEPHRGFEFRSAEGPDSLLDGFTITNGYGPKEPFRLGGFTFQHSAGGGIFCYGSPEIINCTFSNNTAERSGGGMFNRAGSPTVVNCTFIGNSAHWGGGGGMYNEGGSPTLANCTFSGNSVDTAGGGMYSYGSPTLTNCTFSGNSAYSAGGGMYSFGSPTLTNCTFSGNSAGEDGGGMYNGSHSATIITNCSFSRNWADRGGAMFNYESYPNLMSCVFTGNSANNGGGIYNRFSSPNVSNCIFSGNSAEYGGGIENDHSRLTDDSIIGPTITNCRFGGNTAVFQGGGMYNYSILTVTNCTFTGNSANDGGGGMYTATVRITITNCTFTGNSANNFGGGMSAYDSANMYDVSNLINCIFWGNIAPTEPEISVWSYLPPVVTYCDIQDGWPGTGNIDADPCFVDANGADNILGTEDDNPSLLAGSACADAGNNDAVPAGVIVDLHGDPRFVDDPYALDTGYGTPPIVDMGAYEGTKQSFVLNTASVTVPEGQTATFTVALLMEPAGTVQVTVAFESGDPDITIVSGGTLTFKAFNYSAPQTVVLAAAEDEDKLHDITTIRISAPGFINCVVTATELDNEPNPHLLFVDANAPGGNNGMDWANAFTDLQDALHLAEACEQFEQVLVAQGVYTPAPPSGDREATFQLVSGIAVMGGYAGFGEPDPDARDIELYETILSGDLNGDDCPDFANNDDNTYHVVTGSGTNATAVLDGFTITGGNANGGGTANYGGGMYNYDECSPTLTNCTFSGNSAGNRGGGMYNYNSSPTIINCILWGNEAPYGSEIYGSASVSYSDVQGGWPGTGNKDSDPLFIDASSGNLHLLPGSPCINAGDPNYVAGPNETDLDGLPRIIGSRVDMGAYEFNHQPVADAGPNQVVYADHTGWAEVTLDGSASYDDDGQDLTYKWSWTIDDNSFTSTGGDGIINLFDFAAFAEQWPQFENPFADLSILAEAWLSTPASPNWNGQSDIAPAGAIITIELPVGEHTVELVVNDGLVDSEPDYVDVNVIAPLEAGLCIIPRVVNRQSCLPKHILAVMTLPESVEKDDITDEPFVLYPADSEEGIEACWQYVYTWRHRVKAVALFDKAELMDAVPENGWVELNVFGRLMSGQYFYGTDSVRIIDWTCRH